MALFDINKIKGNALDAGTKLSQGVQIAKDKASELTNATIRKLLQGVNLDGLIKNVEDYQQKTGKDASKLIEFINNLKKMQHDGETDED